MKKTEVELESRVIQGAHGVAAEEDHIKTGKIVATGALALGIFVVGCLWAVWLQVSMQREVNPDGPAPVPAVVGQYEIGIVNQRLFEQDWHAVDKIGGQQQALGAGWGDQPGVKTHPNLDEAMERVINEARNPPPPPPSPAPPTTPPATPPTGTPASPRQ